MTTPIELSERIYEAAFIPEFWPNIFQTLAERTDSALGSMFTIADKTLKWTGTPLANQLIEEHLPNAESCPNPRPERGKHIGRYQFAADQDFLDITTLNDEPFYRDFLYPRGYGWFIGTTFNLPTGDQIHMSVERRFDRGPFEARFIDEMNYFRPHLGRAALLSARLSLERARAMTQALDCVGVPAAVVKSSGGLMAANLLFEELIPSVVMDRNERIMLRDARADLLLKSAIETAGAADGRRRGRSIPIGAKEERPPQVVHVAPICRAAHDVFSRGVAIIAILTLDRRRAPDALLLQSLFDLTPAEARIARGMGGEAKSVSDMAAALGLSRETVRAQLKSVMAKTGVNRQAELVRIIAGSAPLK